MTAVKSESSESLDHAIVRAAENTAASVRAARAAIGVVIFGQDEEDDRALITVLAVGDALLAGVPGVANTKLVHTMRTVLGLEGRHVQFPQALMPSHILGAV